MSNHPTPPGPEDQKPRAVPPKQPPQGHEAKKDRHKKRHKVGIHPHLNAALERLAQDNHSHPTEEIVNAVRHYLRHLGYLPPLGPGAREPDGP